MIHPKNVCIFCQKKLHKKNNQYPFKRTEHSILGQKIEIHHRWLVFKKFKIVINANQHICQKCNKDFMMHFSDEVVPTKNIEKIPNSFSDVLNHAQQYILELEKENKKKESIIQNNEKTKLALNRKAKHKQKRIKALTDAQKNIQLDYSATSIKQVNDWPEISEPRTTNRYTNCCHFRLMTVSDCKMHCRYSYEQICIIKEEVYSQITEEMIFFFFSVYV